jgi:hypothetical protein
MDECFACCRLSVLRRCAKIENTNRRRMTDRRVDCLLYDVWIDLQLAPVSRSQQKRDRDIN